MEIDLFFQIVVLILSIILHEISHGYAAEMYGDPTARLAGRLTLNPIKHIDLFGSIILPALLVFSGSRILIGWAKPVPYNPYNLKGRFAETVVALAGVLVNIAIAVIFGLLIRFGGPSMSPAFLSLLSIVVYINLLLAFFNLIPIPPLDGSRALTSLLPYHLLERYRAFETRIASFGLIASFLFLLLFIQLIWPFFAALLSFVFSFITGASLY